MEACVLRHFTSTKSRVQGFSSYVGILICDVTVAGEGSDCQIYNVLDVPAGVVPVTTVTADDVRKMTDYPDVNEAYREIKKVFFRFKFTNSLFCPHETRFHGTAFVYYKSYCNAMRYFHHTFSLAFLSSRDGDLIVKNFRSDNPPSRDEQTSCSSLLGWS